MYLADAGANHVWLDGDVDPTGTVGTVVAAPAVFQGWTVSHGFSYVGGQDVFGREFETELLSF